MPLTLRGLLLDKRFPLRPLVSASGVVLDRPLEWAHSSDLVDPTPWLESGGVLLTDGAQFLSADHDMAAQYVRRLHRHGVLGLGFATHVVHKAVPGALVDACLEQGLPLFEVPAGVPFMGLIRAVSDAVAADERVRLERSLAAQRSVARAALRPDGLASILRELERNLNTWVALYGANGQQVPVPDLRPVPEQFVPDVVNGVRDALVRPRPSGSRISFGDAGTVTLQTLGHGGSLRGVLAVGRSAEPRDRVGDDLIESVIALASIALEQTRTLDDARRRLRSGILELLVNGATGVADSAARHLWGTLPEAPFVVADLGFATPPKKDMMSAALELLSESQPGAVFHAEQGERLVAVVPVGLRDQFLELASQHHARLGLSGTYDWPELGAALAEASRMAQQTSDLRPVVIFDDLADAGILGYLEKTRAHDIAWRMLAPMEKSPDGPQLRASVETWLEYNCAWEPASKALGVHRHTLRARVRSAENLLGLDFDAFGTRAEVWAALQLTHTWRSVARGSAGSRG